MTYGSQASRKVGMRWVGESEKNAAQERCCRSAWRPMEMVERSGGRHGVRTPAGPGESKLAHGSTLVSERDGFRTWRTRPNKRALAGGIRRTWVRSTAFDALLGAMACMHKRVHGWMETTRARSLCLSAGKDFGAGQHGPDGQDVRCAAHTIERTRRGSVRLPLDDGWARGSKTGD